MMVCFICQSSMIVGPALADLAAAYPNVPYANILLISTIPQLCGIPVSLITGKIAGSKVKYKTLAATCALIGGVLPFFIRSFPIILLSRVIFGLSYNISVPFTNSLPLLYFDKQKAANRSYSTECDRNACTVPGRCSVCGKCASYMAGTPVSCNSVDWYSDLSA